MNDAAPLFLFLFPDQRIQTNEESGAPFLTVLDCTGTVACQTPQTLVSARYGHRMADVLEAGQTEDLDRSVFRLPPLEDRCGDWLAYAAFALLATYTPDGFDVQSLKEQGPKAIDVYEKGGIAQTRDALFWVAPIGTGCGAPAEIGGCVTERRVSLRMAESLHAALELAKVTVPDGTHFADILDHFMVGFLSTMGSGHARLTRRQRVLEDISLFPALWKGMGGNPRPVVPVFL